MSNALYFLGLGQQLPIKTSKVGIFRLQLNASTLLEGCFMTFGGCNHCKVVSALAAQGSLNRVSRVARDTTPHIK